MTQSSPVAKSAPAFHWGAGLVVLASCLMATQDAFAKVLGGVYSPFQVGWLRFAIHAALVVLWLVARGHRGFWRTQNLPLHVARALALVLASQSMYWAVTFMPLAQATVIQFLCPVIVTLLSVIWLGERIGIRRICAVLAGFAGVAVVLSPNLGHFSPAMVLPLITATALAVFVLLTRRLSTRSEALAAFGLMPVICTIAVAPTVPFVWQPIAPGDLGVFFVLACCGTLAQVFLQLGLQFAPASTMTPYQYAQVLWAAGLSIVFFGDPLGIHFIFGAALIVCSGLFIWWFETAAKTQRT